MIINRISDTLMKKMIAAHAAGEEIKKGLYYCESKNLKGENGFTGMAYTGSHLYAQGFNTKMECFRWLMYEA